MSRTPVNKESINLRLALGAGVIGIAVAIMSQIASVPIDQIQASPLRWGIIAFSVGIPLIGLDLYATYCESLIGYSIKSRSRTWARFLGFALMFGGLDTLFWHFDPLAGGISILVSVIAFLFWHQFYESLLAAKDPP